MDVKLGKVTSHKENNTSSEYTETNYSLQDMT